MNDSIEARPASPQPRHLPLPMARPRVTYVLLAINILVWLAMTAAGGSTDPAVLVRFGAKFNPLIVQGQVWRLLTSIFSMKGEAMGRILSTPIFPDIFLTVKVSELPFPLRWITTPRNCWIRSLFPSLIL